MKKFSDFIREEEMHELKMHPQHKQIKKYAKAKASDTFKRTFGAVGDGGPEGDTSAARAAGKKVLRKLKKPLAKTGMTKAANKIAKKSSDRMIDLTRQDSGSSEPVKKFTNKQRKDQMKTGNYPDANDKEYRKNVEQVDEGALADKAKKSGISVGTLRKVYNRGMAAWKTGHRPGTTPQQWGHARVNAFITKKKKGGLNHDKDLA